MKVVLGIDIGGTYTRVMAVDLTGKVRSFKRTVGIKSIEKTVLKVIGETGSKLKDVVSVAAGLKGLNSSKDQEWAERLIEIPGLTCPRILVNDTVVAHTGAFGKQPGITVVGGTGSNLLGVIEKGKHIFIQEFWYSPFAGGYDLGLDITLRIIAGKAQKADQELVEKVLAHWNVSNITGLRDLFLKRRIDGNIPGTLAPFITDAAKRGIPLACDVCNDAIDRLLIAVQLLGSCFKSESVSVALTGSVLQSVYMNERVKLRLKKLKNKDYDIIEPTFSPVAGAVIMAFESIGIIPDEKILKRLRRHPETKGSPFS